MTRLHVKIEVVQKNPLHMANPEMTLGPPPMSDLPI